MLFTIFDFALGLRVDLLQDEDLVLQAENESFFIERYL